MTDCSFIGVTGSAIGSDPFHRRSWSGSSYYFFMEMKRRQILNRAFGLEATAPKYLSYFRNYHVNRNKWKNRHYLDIGYRNALTRKASEMISDQERNCQFIQIGGYFDMPTAVGADTSYYAYYDGNLTSRLKSGYSLGASDRAIRAALDYERELLSRMTRVFTFSDYLKQSFVEDYGLRADKVVNIGAGMNLDTISAVNPAKRYDRKQILFIGVDFERKGGFLLLQAFKGVKSRFSDASLHVVGPPENSIPAQDGVVFHGFVSKDDQKFQELMSEASVFVLPSVFEPFGIAPLEAMVNEIPAVVTGEWALAEIVVDGVTGQHVRPNDADHLEDILIEMLSEPDRLATLGKAARKHTIENFTWEKTVDRLLANVS